jgi:hypothetical protein
LDSLHSNPKCLLISNWFMMLHHLHFQSMHTAALQQAAVVLAV